MLPLLAAVTSAASSCFRQNVIWNDCLIVLVDPFKDVGQQFVIFVGIILLRGVRRGHVELGAEKKIDAQGSDEQAE